MSRMPFEILLALRYLRPKRTFVSVITLISIIGVMLGVAVLIVVLSVMTGFDRELRDKILGFNPHIRIGVLNARPMRNHEQVMDKVKENPSVVAVAPYVFGQALAETQPEVGDPSFFAPYIRGLDPKLEKGISNLPDNVVSGEFNLKGNRIVIGQGTADNFNLRVGDKLAIYSPADLRKMKEAKKTEEEEAILPDDYEVAGIFDVGYYEYNSNFIIMSLGNAQDLYDLDENVHGVFIKIKDPDQAAVVRSQLTGFCPPSFYLSTWLEENSTFLDALVVEKNVMFYILFVVMIVAAFGITNALITFVVQKTREIGMLKALGATNPQIMLIFLSQSFMVGLLGVITGFCLGMLMVQYRNDFLRVMNRLFKFELFPKQIYMFSELPALIVAQDVLLICGGSLLICLLAGLIPAWTASRLKPVEALRHE